jgi:hypothetical protein
MPSRLRPRSSRQKRAFPAARLGRTGPPRSPADLGLVLQPGVDPLRGRPFVRRPVFGSGAHDVEHRLVGERLTAGAATWRRIRNPKQVNKARHADLPGGCREWFRSAPEISESNGTRRLGDHVHQRAARQFILMAGDLRTDSGQEWRTVRGLRAHLDRPSIDDERPPVEGAGDLADQDKMSSRNGERTESSRDVRGARRRESSHAAEWIELELERDLRPPRTIVDDEVGFEMESACRGRSLDVLHDNLAVAPLPPRDRRLTHPEPLRKLPLGEARSSARHENVISTTHTVMVSAVWS